ncbi:M3 family oligoendopeptidase [Thaumasiovibrio subtropicus]|uniref:M3 family oligoendopeptidase n=1 Tax=Thaumasiovibrio subtropicus TaxID=1891207 RepID=UPI000B34F6FE|nr:M3 family oligoendopeptidase [Thaumasiovibrio subtropicus]
MSAPVWDLTIAYQSLTDEKIQRDIQFVRETGEKIAALSTDSIEEMQTALALYDKALTQLLTLQSYSSCIASTDANNEAARSLYVKSSKLNSDFYQHCSALRLALVNHDDETVEAVLAGNNETGSLAHHGFLIALQRKERVFQLGLKEEQLLAAMNVDGKEAWGRLYDNLTGSLEVTLKLDDGTEETIGLATAASILYGSDEKRRAPAWHAISDIMKTHQVSIAAILNAIAGSRLTEYQKRSHTETLDYLTPSLNDSRIERATLEALMDVAWENRDIGQKAGLLMAKMFGTDKLKPWDELASMPSQKGVASEYSFEDAIEIIKEAFAGVDPEMADFVDYMVDQKLIDAAPAQSKRLGAYCTRFADTRTPLVFMTWGNSMSDVITLAHELGHAFHNWVLNERPLALASYPMTLAETASIFAENVVRDALLAKTSTDDEKLHMLWEEAQSALALTINIPVRFDFENNFYAQRQQGELTAEQLRALMAEKWAKWYGEAMTETNEMFWASKLHFSIDSVSFYNYPYLFGYLFSKGVYAQREAKGDSFYQDYKALLMDTGCMSAEEVVQKHLGMDIRKPEFWQQSMDLIRKDVEAFERLLS